jgi:prevent-host-death family protein
MLSQTVDVQEAQKRLSDLLGMVKAGGEVTLTDGDRPIARLVPAKVASKSRVPGLHAGMISTTDDFDEPC